MFENWSAVQSLSIEMNDQLKFQRFIEHVENIFFL